MNPFSEDKLVEQTIIETKHKAPSLQRRGFGGGWEEYIQETIRTHHGVGKYVIDFYCVKKKLAVEDDGEVHYD